MFGPTWPFLLILITYGFGVVFIKYWDRLCKSREISNFWKNGKIVISVKNPKFIL